MTRDEQWLLEEKYPVKPRGHGASALAQDLARLRAGEPVAYVIGWQPFLGLKIHLDSKPLIPRPETEWWTKQLLRNLEVGLPRGSPTSKLRFLDLCAGSGAIGCAALARLPDANVYFGEIDSAHEATIPKNIRANRLDEARANIRIGDLFEPFAGLTFDFIAANPPYIPAGRTLPSSVADYEPAGALYAGADGLDVIRRIAVALPRFLAPGGQAWVEVDSAHAAAACALFTARDLHAEIRTDQYRQPRILIVTYP